jgi:hypothetical protein
MGPGHRHKSLRVIIFSICRPVGLPDTKYWPAWHCSRAAAVAASRAASLASRSARAAAADAARISAALDPESCPKTKPREAVTKLPAFPTMITFAAPHSSNCQVNQSSFFLHLINSLCLCNSLCVSYYM